MYETSATGVDRVKYQQKTGKLRERVTLDNETYRCADIAPFANLYKIELSEYLQVGILSSSHKIGQLLSGETEYARRDLSPHPAYTDT